MVDVVGDLRRQRAERIVGQCGEMDDRVETVQLLERHIPQVHLDARWILRSGAEHAVGEKAGVQTGYVVPRGLQDRHHDRAQITLMPGDQYSHPHTSHVSWSAAGAADALPIAHCIALQRRSNVTVAFSTMKASACGLRHCTPRSLDSPRNACSSNQSWLACDG